MDTIAAIITPPGEGGIAGLRIAGPDSKTILNRLFKPQSGAPHELEPFHLYYGSINSIGGELLDEVMAVFMPEDHSYTALEQVELFCHGGRQVSKMILDEIVGCGARVAEPGEFTKLAFLNGRIDLARAEAVAEMISANSLRSYETSRDHLLGGYSALIESIRQRLVKLLAEVEASIDFSEEDIEEKNASMILKSTREIKSEIDTLLQSYESGRIVRDGFKIVIAGRPNAGKSSLFNLLLKNERALVNPTAGTTRDYLSEWIEISGQAVNIIDTAGFRSSGDEIEMAGQERAREIVEQADLILWIFDVSDKSGSETIENDLQEMVNKPICVIGNKIDLL
ncbi:MAG: tRNA uridine-5-carboxymethylaminomethyl(34) synthesis GTPase MnmE, partial [candidate division Zixibacteria bacterium]